MGEAELREAILAALRNQANLTQRNLLRDSLKERLGLGFGAPEHAQVRRIRPGGSASTTAAPDEQHIRKPTDVELAAAVCLGLTNVSHQTTYFDPLDATPAKSTLASTEPWRSDSPTNHLDSIGVALAKMDAALSRLGTAAAQYVALVARLSNQGDDVAPLDACDHILDPPKPGGDPCSKIRERLRAVKEEREFWQLAAGLFENASKEAEDSSPAEGSSTSEDATTALDGEWLGATCKHALEALRESVEVRRAGLEHAKEIWSRAKAQINLQTYKRLMATNYRPRARQLTAELNEALDKATAEVVSARGNTEHASSSQARLERLKGVARQVLAQEGLEAVVL